ncbi:hypothetical protein [Microbacterium galbinum]|uniref:Lipoprotein n=1 Tax=Microbacterium galbinum TaxID=2851646 RepID=A0ABY4ISN3_9MICO|nr:hypothetical protein [Microbacterium galbinum]UPL15693.1 hypothetical protein KV396_14925 [Microbacterium galbinum]
MKRTLPRVRIAVTLSAVAALVGCSPSPASVQPEVDAAVVASLPEDFAEATTTYDEASDECLTIVAMLPERYGLSARSVQEAVELLREGAATLSCRGVLRVVDDEGEVRDVSHLQKYLDVEARNGDLVIL